jgi:hypothetical protein
VRLKSAWGIGKVGKSKRHFDFRVIILRKIFYNESFQQEKVKVRVVAFAI